MLKALFNCSNSNRINLSAQLNDGKVTLIVCVGDNPPISFVDGLETIDQNLLPEIESIFSQTVQVRSSVAFFQKELEKRELELKEKAAAKKATPASPAVAKPAVVATPSLFDAIQTTPSVPATVIPSVVENPATELDDSDLDEKEDATFEISEREENDYPFETV